MSTYTITRHFASGDRETLQEGLTLEEARDHCKSPETSSRTATAPDLIALTAARGPWFDGYEEQA